MTMDESRSCTLHLPLGGGRVADVLLWKNRRGSLALLAGSTALWFLFEKAGYNVLSFISNVLALNVIILFAWGKSASLLNRPLPPLPNLVISEDSTVKAADKMFVWINHILSIAHDISFGRNLTLFIQVATCLWVISYVGSLFNFLTLIYIVILLSLTLPVLYCKYQKQIQKLKPVYNIARNLLRMILSPSHKEKKIQ